MGEGRDRHGNTDNSGIRKIAILQEQRFEFCRRDLQPFHLDEFLLLKLGALSIEWNVWDHTFLRSTTNKTPFSSTYATSPVFNHPSVVKLSSVAFGFLQYPLMTFRPLHQISPRSPGGTSLVPLSSINLTWVFALGVPTPKESEWTLGSHPRIEQVTLVELVIEVVKS